MRECKLFVLTFYIAFAWQVILSEFIYKNFCCRFVVVERTKEIIFFNSIPDFENGYLKQQTTNFIIISHTHILLVFCPL